jgi:hypothetical protein
VRVACRAAPSLGTVAAVLGVRSQSGVFLRGEGTALTHGSSTGQRDSAANGDSADLARAERILDRSTSAKREDVIADIVNVLANAPGVDEADAPTPVRDLIIEVFAGHEWKKAVAIAGKTGISEVKRACSVLIGQTELTLAVV